MNRRIGFSTFLLSAAPLLVIGAEPDVDEVVVTSTPLRQSNLETVQPTLVLDSDELVKMRGSSLGETLANQPGVTGSYFGPQASRPVIRGLGGERVQMYEDSGEALDVSALSSDHAVAIEPLVAEGIEVVRGPATLLYGNGASGGLVNVLTNRIPSRVPEQPLSAALELRGNTALEERAGALRLDGGNSTWAWHGDFHTRETDDLEIADFALSRRLRAQLAEEGEAITGTRGRLENTASESLGGSLGGTWFGSWGFAGLSLGRYESDYGIPNLPELHHEEDEEHEEEEDHAAHSDVRVDMAQTRYDLKSELVEPLPIFSNIRLRATYSRYHHEELEPEGVVGTRFDQDGIDARVLFDHVPLGEWRGTFGVQYRVADLESMGEEAFVPTSRTRHVGYFAYEERPLGPLTLQLGGRLEQQEIEAEGEEGPLVYDRNSLSASAGALWKMAPAYNLSLNLTSTERHPTATELYAAGPHIAAQRFEIGDATLERERANTVDLGLRKFAGSWHFAVSAFYSDYSRFTFAAPTELEEHGLPVVQYTQADARFRGLEAELHLPDLAIAGGTLSTHLMADYVRATLDDGGDLPQIPPLRTGAELTFVRDQFSASVSAMYHDMQDKVALNELPTDSFTLVDVDLSYRIPSDSRSVLVFLRGENLLDEDARRHTSPLKDFAPLPGRAIAGGVRLEL